MLKVRRSKLYTAWFGWYSRRQFRRFFNSVRVVMQPGVREMDRRTPVIFYANHAYWWDGFWSQLCTEEFFHQRLHIIIELQQLQKHQFFTRIGAFSLDQSRPKSLPATLNYAAELLSDANDRQNALWIFPQGKIEHIDKRPLLFYKGTASIISRLLAKTPQVYLVSVVSRIEYLEEQKPELFLSFRKPLLITRKNVPSADALTIFMREMTESNLDELRENIQQRQLNDATVLIKGSASVNRKSEAFARFLQFGRAHNRSV